MQANTKATEAKANIMERFQRTAKDTGSPEVQVALLTARINLLTEHLKVHKKDFHSRRGLIKMVKVRFGLLNYLKRKNQTLHNKVVQELNLRG